MRRLDWGEIVRLRDAEGLDFAEIARRMGKYTAAIQRAYEGAKRQGWTSAGAPDGEEVGERTEQALSMTSGIARIAQFEKDEVQELREMLAWWRHRKSGEDAIQAIPISNTKRTRRTFWMDDELHKALNERAGEEGRSMTALIDEALRRYLTSTN